MTMDDLKDILATNPDMLERYVMEVISLETLEKWHQRKAEKLGKSFKKSHSVGFPKAYSYCFPSKKGISTPLIFFILSLLGLPVKPFRGKNKLAKWKVGKCPIKLIYYCY